MSILSIKHIPFFFLSLLLLLLLLLLPPTAPENYIATFNRPPPIHLISNLTRRATSVFIFNSTTHILQQSLTPPELALLSAHESVELVEENKAVRVALEKDYMMQEEASW